MPLFISRAAPGAEEDRDVFPRFFKAERAQTPGTALGDSLLQSLQGRYPGHAPSPAPLTSFEKIKADGTRQRACFARLKSLREMKTYTRNHVKPLLLEVESQAQRGDFVPGLNVSL